MEQNKTALEAITQVMRPSARVCFWGIWLVCRTRLGVCAFDIENQDTVDVDEGDFVRQGEMWTFHPAQEGSAHRRLYTMADVYEVLGMKPVVVAEAMLPLPRVRLLPEPESRRARVLRARTELALMEALEPENPVTVWGLYFMLVNSPGEMMLSAELGDEGLGSTSGEFVFDGGWWWVPWRDEPVQLATMADVYRVMGCPPPETPSFMFPFPHRW